MVAELSRVADVLGGEKVLGCRLESDLDFVELGTQGVTKSALSHLAAHLALSWKQMAQLLPVTERTLQRYAPKQRLSRAVSEQAIDIAQVATRGQEVFGDRALFLAWVDEPNTALGGRTPLSLLASRFGARMVLDVLGRIEHGVYS